MSIYAELSKLHERRMEALDIQSDLLRRAVFGLKDGFSQYLGLEEKRWRFPDGTPGDYYVRLGVGDGEGFEECIGAQLPSQCEAISFTLTLTIILEDPRRYEIFSFPMSIEMNESGFLFRLESADDVLLDVHEAGSGHFDKVYAAMVAHAERKLSRACPRTEQSYRV